jgi:hypothetical protein
VACRTPSGGKLTRLRKGGFLFHKARIEAVASVDPDDAR